MPVFGGTFNSPRMSCSWEVGTRLIGGRGQLEGVVLARSRCLVLAPRATTIVTAHGVSEREKTKSSNLEVQIRSVKHRGRKG